MTIGQILLRLTHQKSEGERRSFRVEMARTLAEVEDLHRQLNGYMAAKDSEIKVKEEKK